MKFLISDEVEKRRTKKRPKTKTDKHYKYFIKLKFPEVLMKASSFSQLLLAVNTPIFCRPK